MLILLALPVITVVATFHRYLQCCAPSNLLARRVRTATPTVRLTVVLLALGAVLLVSMHILAEAIAAGAPSWLNLVVLVLAWDAIKVGLLAAHSGLRALAPPSRRTFRCAVRSVPADS